MSLLLLSILLFKANFAQAVTDFVISDVKMKGTIAQIVIENQAEEPQSFAFQPSLGCQETFPMGCRGKIIKVQNDAAKVIDVDEVKTIEVDMAKAFGYEANVIVEIVAGEQYFFAEF